MPTAGTGPASPLRRPRLTPAIADTRRAVRSALVAAQADTAVAVGADSLVLVALSGGPDSLALAAATAFEAPRLGIRAGAVVVDHRLQRGSTEQAQRAATQARELGLDPVDVVQAHVHMATDGPEAAARDARYRAILDHAARCGAGVVLLGHTLDDQAETVLLGLARGSGPTSIRGMAASTPARSRPDGTTSEGAAVTYLRPFLGIRHATTEAACADAGLASWHDPWNDDRSFTRVRVRATVLPTLERELGPGIAEALARTAVQLREDDDALAALALEWALELTEHDDETGGVALDIRGLAADPPALRQRIVRLVISNEFGTALSREHTLAICALIDDWHGQGAPSVPGIRVMRRDGRLIFISA